jgi:hypothetical protein
MGNSISEKAKTDKTPQGVSWGIVAVILRTKSAISLTFCTPSSASYVEALPEEYWQRQEDACTEAYKRLGLAQEEATNLLIRLSKIRWGLRGQDAEAIPCDVRRAMYGFAKFIRAETERMLPDPRAKGFVGGRRIKIPRSCYTKLRAEAKALSKAKRKQFYKKKAKLFGSKPSTMERVCQTKSG